MIDNFVPHNLLIQLYSILDKSCTLMIQPFCLIHFSSVVARLKKIFVETLDESDRFKNDAMTSLTIATIHISRMLYLFGGWEEGNKL